MHGNAIMVRRRSSFYWPVTLSHRDDLFCFLLFFFFCCHVSWLSGPFFIFGPGHPRPLAPAAV